MVYGLWLSAAGMAANQYRQNVASNNMANINTVGFKHDLAVLQERAVEAASHGDGLMYGHAVLDWLSGGTHVTPTVHSFEPGPTMTTHRPLDAKIDGPGFYRIATPAGERYTRDGRFALDAGRRLVTVAGGHAVLSDGGGEIVAGPGAPPEIDEGGRVRQGETVLATLGLVEFNDRSLLRKQGGNLFLATAGAAAAPARDSRITPRALEASNIDPVDGLVDMIEASRGFEINANLVSLQDAMIGRAVNEIARF